MDLYFNKKIKTVTPKPTHTVGNVKKAIRDWLEPQGIKDYTLSLTNPNYGDYDLQLIMKDDNYNLFNIMEGSILTITVGTETPSETLNLTTNISSMPRELMIKLALDMDVKDILALCQTSKRFNEVICNDNELWRKLIERDFGVKNVYEPSKSRYEEYSKYR